ncbi:hypothetical protein LSM04_005745 [Trypanosoma melophagium]|uniref:uncharacterized protein n=1 Tax=Trypanosoma melophagium TaxID=715481 RepID=UPI00351A8164|nr:hypothetical protein LSM04_005745 [Trypanosoma melophagium]
MDNVSWEQLSSESSDDDSPSLAASTTEFSSTSSSSEGTSIASNNTPVPSFWTQTFAAIKRDVAERRQSLVVLLLEIVVPLLFIVVTVGMWYFYGEAKGDERKFVNYDNIPRGAGVVPYTDGICYNDTMIGPTGNPNMIPGLQPCSKVTYDVNCKGDERFIPVKGLCTDASRSIYLEFTNGAAGELNAIPELDKVLLNHWIATKEMGSVDEEPSVFPSSGKYLKRLASVVTSGFIFIGPSDKVPPTLLKDFQSSSKYFNYVYAGTFDDISQLEKNISDGVVFAIINIKEMTEDRFDVEIKMSDTAFPSPETIINGAYFGTYENETSELYIISGFLTLQKMVYNHYLNYIVSGKGTVPSFEPYVVSMGNPPYQMPKLIQWAEPVVCFVIVLSFLYPVTQVVRQRTLQKELRLWESMQIMGMRPFALNISWFVLEVGIMFIISLFSAALMRVYIWGTGFFFVFLILFLFSLSAIAFAGFMASLFSKSRLAAMMVPLLYICLSSPVIAMPYLKSAERIAVCISPPAAFSLALDIMFKHEADGGFRASHFNDTLDEPTMLIVFGMIALDFFLYLLLMLYLEAVMPRDWGTPKHPLFFIIEPFKCCCGKREDWAAAGPDGRDPNGIYEDPIREGWEYYDNSEEGEDDLLGTSSTFALRIRGLRQEFKRGGKTFVAVNNLYWDMPGSGVSVLLGQNGAGKSTTINMITGVMKPIAGDCTVYGHSLRADLAAVRQEMAICPQHNVLWPELTCQEHLEFFGRIKGLKGAELEDAVMSMLKKTDLYEKRNYKSSALSGGQKRKLSVGIAFVGGSRLVLLDEPTAGMDVAARRHTWKLLQLMSLSRAILLTTHFMDEAEILGDQIAIMSRGSLKCSGSSLFLKSRLGNDYNITISLNSTADFNAIDRIISHYVPDAVFASRNSSELAYRLPSNSIYSFVPLLRNLEAESKAVGIDTYAVSAMTLEDVFLRVIGKDADVEQLPEGTENILWDCQHVTRTCDKVRLQCRALLLKRILGAIRDWWILGFQIIFPVICVLVAILLDRLLGKKKASVSLSPSIYGIDTMSDTSGCSKFFNTANYKIPGSNTQLFMTDRNMLNSLNMSWYHVDTYLHHPKRHLSSFFCNDMEYEAKLGKTPIILFYNTSAPHEIAIALNTLYSFIIKSVGGTVSFQTTASHLSAADNESSKNAVSTILKGVIISVPFCVLPSNCVAWIRVNPNEDPWAMDNVGWPCLYMAIEFPIFSLITLLIDHPKLRMMRRKRQYHPDGFPESNNDSPTGESTELDSDVEEERELVLRNWSDLNTVPDNVEVLNLRKVYSNGKVAVNNLALGVVKGEVFGFLGTNGAGKTTTMSILCQKILPTSGRALICGYDIVEESAAARSFIGYCPQFDATLDILTVEEHLELFAALHGIHPDVHAKIINVLLQLCGVMEYRKTLSRDLSGGNRRKLSLALALMGGPLVLLLDEPSAGMDPVARRGVWISVERVATRCSVLLTTHHLEEVEALANYVAIMVDGVLRCIGNKTHLKEKYGSGVEMTLRIESEGRYRMVHQMVIDNFPGAVMNEYRNLLLVYSLPKGTPFSEVFYVLHRNKMSVGITDYSVSQTSIEQVFMRISEGARCGRTSV